MVPNLTVLGSKEAEMRIIGCSLKGDVIYRLDNKCCGVGYRDRGVSGEDTAARGRFGAAVLRRTAEACAGWNRGHQVDAVVSEADGRAQD
jgi:hypothetical protein